MNKNITCAWGHAELRKVLEAYFNGHIEKPLVIFSKPSSGRTTAVQEVAKTLGVNDNDIFNKHIFSDPFGKDKIMDVFIEEAIKDDFRYDRKYKIFEIDPNWMSAMPDDINPFNPKSMDMGIGLIQFYQSEDYHCVFFRPTVKDWIEWAAQNGVTPEVVDFAREYPAFYAITYEIYHRLNRELSLFEDGDDINDLMHLGYSGFMNQMTKPIVEKFIEHLMGTRFKDVIEPALNRLK